MYSYFVDKAKQSLEHFHSKGNR